MPDYTNLFSPNDYEKNGKMIYLYLYNYIYYICGKYIKFEKPKIYIKEKTVLSSTCSKYKKEDEKMFKEEESIEILKILGLTENI